MGIRYYAYAYDRDRTQEALERPFAILSSDPLADAWGLEPHASVSTATFQQVPSLRDMLYLDKAWSSLQSLTAPVDDGASGESCYRMFEGRVTPTGFGWDPWVRTIVPDDMLAIHGDLQTFDEDRVRGWMHTWRNPYGTDDDDERRYVMEHLRSAQRFVEGLVEDGRGMVYLIG